jgi:hypothetical protein
VSRAACAGALVALLCATILAPLPAAAQSYRLRLDARAQTVAFRGVTADSILATETIPGPNGGPVTPDGLSVSCGPFPYCYFFRPGPLQRTAPLTTGAAVTVWGFGVPGLRVHADARLAGDLGGDADWPGLDPALQLLEGFAEYANERITARLGRQTVIGRLGFAGFDGGRITGRLPRHGLEAEGYLGWGLARAIALPVTSPALDPLDQFQPRDRQIIAGLAAGWRAPVADLRAEYRREIDPGSDYFVSERMSVSGTLRPLRRWTAAAGMEYDLAFGQTGTADASLRYNGDAVGGLVGYRRYRPHFDLWTIWGAFSPAAYDDVHAMAWAQPLSSLRLTVRGERFWYEPTDAGTPLVRVEDAGWRVRGSASWRPAPRWQLDGGYLAEFGPGAASRSADAGVTWTPTDRLSVSGFGALLARPLEFRFSETEVTSLGLDVNWDARESLRLGAGLAHYWEERERPDASGIDWTQTRLHLRATMLFESGADRDRLPPARRRRGAGE